MLKESIIRKRNGKWVVLSHDGKKELGTYDTKEEAVKRLRQIEYFKNHPKKSYKDKSLNQPGAPSCSWCEEPSTADNPVKEFRTVNGVRIFRHITCQDEATTDDSVDNYISLSSKKMSRYPVLVCDNPHCGAVIDTGDENETDGWRAPGEVCLDCGRGEMGFQVAAFTSGPSRVPWNPNYTNPWTTLRGDPQAALQALPKGFKDPADAMRPGTKTEVKGLTKNNDKTPGGKVPGAGDIDDSYTTIQSDGQVITGAARGYISMKEHLIAAHGYRRNMLRGYSDRVLLAFHQDDHTEGAYDLGHDH